MQELLARTWDRLTRGGTIDRDTALALAEIPDRRALFRLADNVRRHFHGSRFHLCSIINARSGNCSEDCRFCAQSSRHHTGVETYRVIDLKKALDQARDNDAHGVDRLSLVTSGRALDNRGLDDMEPLYREIAGRTGMRLCASMGLLDEQRLARLRRMGVDRYHCNLETCRAHFPAICSSHGHDDKLRTLETARRLGFSLCCGGIIGLGETREQRLELALELRELRVDSIPINILTPIPGTPLAEFPVPAVDEILTTIALFRLINPGAVIRIAGGRQQLGDDQYRCFAAGANGAIVGNYLTTIGTSIAQDLARLAEMGYTFARLTP